MCPHMLSTHFCFILYIFGILAILFINVTIDKLGIDSIRINLTTVEGLLIEIGSLI